MINKLKERRQDAKMWREMSKRRKKIEKLTDAIYKLAYFEQGRSKDDAKKMAGEIFFANGLTGIVMIPNQK